MLNRLEKLWEEGSSAPPEPMPTGTREEVGRELLRRCKERDARMEQTALEAEREGDHDGCWIAMASRAENKRFMDRLEADLNSEEG